MAGPSNTDVMMPAVWLVCNTCAQALVRGGGCKGDLECNSLFLCLYNYSTLMGKNRHRKVHKENKSRRPEHEGIGLRTVHAHTQTNNQSRRPEQRTTHSLVSVLSDSLGEAGSKSRYESGKQMMKHLSEYTSVLQINQRLATQVVK